jgi:hypothetical protein
MDDVSPTSPFSRVWNRVDGSLLRTKLLPFLFEISSLADGTRLMRELIAASLYARAKEIDTTPNELPRGFTTSQSNGLLEGPSTMLSLIWE